MQATMDLASQVGVVAACDGMGVALATYHRAKNGPIIKHTVTQPRKSPLALNAQERQMVLETLHASEHAGLCAILSRLGR